MSDKNKPKIVVIVGPTASGKTSLSIEVAKQFNGEVISADSRQVYRGLDIGSGKVTEEEMDGVPHHLLDVADPKDVYNVTDFVRDGRTAIADILARGKLPIVAGGSFFYVDALLGRVSTPEVPPNQELRKTLEEKSTEELFALLEEQDPRRAADIDKDNPVRLIRALEIVEAIGSVPESTQEELYKAFIIGIDIEKEKLHENIHTRLYTRLEEGMIEEVEHLHENGLSYERLESLGLEYRYIAQFLQKKIGKEEMCEKIESESRKFAKRQMTWLKRDKSIRWFKKGEGNEVLTEIEKFL
ncbi:tRNA (adenosine(37)-N6)-dimethylallyltransferase MiaA [Candidatus Parcubacteria bacterium]|uniref:tRNA dimethylallyltransferase n=1 Tax=Candidatus Kaiserbacteria bacterium CG10_big_fil_rev_8_21_14_0_10_47_16 TaxID=1974608 RepID=A0A2H0UCZ2_9BACT|nr:tRNA (adenosine(37)-N6)-dimethylallyltransferase MiaA [Candidatus Parcubacteria bacterium]PIR84257.1 MAG: tRNA (adenosine(37)-N6)-dimethylallyltransferase MiaA [Candidatus Kaiserbacteria bacterium CG10_big_fil_rev_8_21_14_0_10_47_16]